ncbi:hypothetical protein P3G55_18340 [Leptospira sp. 96542]|nr:hypothetical protein [Leptospira sp. 96542]
MKTDTELRVEGMNLLLKNMDIVDAERFFALIQGEKFDYTKWRKNLWEKNSVKEISKLAMENLKQ